MRSLLYCTGTAHRVALGVMLWVGMALTGEAQAVPLAGEYQIRVATTQLGENAYRFTYQIDNVNQSHAERTGLDNFSIELPSTATITAATEPPPYYGAPGVWVTTELSEPFPGWTLVPEFAPDANTRWFEWHGHNTQSVYPTGTTATLSFDVTGVQVGNTRATVSTYWGQTPPVSSPAWQEPTAHTYYSTYTTNVVGPVAICEPATLLLLTGGFFARRRPARRTG